jgi:hypothetical protein
LEEQHHDVKLILLFFLYTQNGKNNSSNLELNHLQQIDINNIRKAKLILGLELFAFTHPFIFKMTFDRTGKNNSYNLNQEQQNSEANTRRVQGKSTLQQTESGWVAVSWYQLPKIFSNS